MLPATTPKGYSWRLSDECYFQAFNERLSRLGSAEKNSQISEKRPGRKCADRSLAIALLPARHLGLRRMLMTSCRLDVRQLEVCSRATADQPQRDFRGFYSWILSLAFLT